MRGSTAQPNKLTCKLDVLMGAGHSGYLKVYILNVHINLCENVAGRQLTFPEKESLQGQQKL